MTRTSAGVVLDELVVLPDDTVLHTMQVIDRSGVEVALVCDAHRRLLATVTDGDIRRHLIRGGGLDAAIGQVGNRNFTAVQPETSRIDAVQMMAERGLKSLPMVDSEGVLVDLHTIHTALLGQRSESWAVVMAGGKGERLGELTQAIPKPMLPVGDRPLLERIVNHLVSHGIRRIFISVAHYAKQIEDYLGDGSGRFCRIEYLRETTPLGTGGPLALLPERPQAPLVVMNGDLLTNVNISRMMAFHRAGGFAGTLALREHVVQVPFGVAGLEGPRVTRLVEKPALNYHISAGIYVLSPEVLARVPAGRMFPITELFAGCLADGLPLGGYHMQEAWNDIGLLEDYERTHSRG